MNNNKIAFTMSNEFIAMVRENINSYGSAGVARLAERRYQFRNPKEMGVEISVEDVKRAVNIHYGVNVNNDRLANIYTWVVNNVRNFVLGVSHTKDVVREAWMSYRKYISDNRLERLWAGAGVTESNSTAEREFRMICSNVAESL